MVETFDVSITPYGLPRRTFVYLPDDWQTSGKKYPVLYMFDGHNLFFDSTATYGTCWGLKEYCPYKSDWFGGITGTGHKYMEWLTKEFKPMMDKRYPTLPGRANTAIGGSSMGGLMSLYAITVYNKVFSKAACLSPSVRLCMPELRQEIANATIHPGTRVYLSWGEKESDKPGALGEYTANALEVCRALLGKGAAVDPYMQPDGTHCEACWAKQVPACMDFLFGGKYE